MRTLPPVKKVLAGLLKTAGPPPYKIFSPREILDGGTLQECSGNSPGAAEVQRRISGFLPDGLPPPDSSTLREPADQPAGLPAGSRMKSVSELDTDRLEAPKACAGCVGY